MPVVAGAIRALAGFGEGWLLPPDPNGYQPKSDDEESGDDAEGDPDVNLFAGHAAT